MINASSPSCPPSPSSSRATCRRAHTSRPRLDASLLGVLVALGAGACNDGEDEWLAAAGGVELAGGAENEGGVESEGGAAGASGAAAGATSAGAGGQAGDSQAGAGEAGRGGAGEAGPLPTLDELEDGWNELRPGGDTVCSRGTEFSFFVDRGTVDKVVIDFMGGGACWDAATCGAANPLFIDAVDPFREALHGGSIIGFGTSGNIYDRGTFGGIYDRERSDNPLRDWHHVVIPYCTGDVHWGDARQDYDGVAIEHRGAVNARAVLAWVYANFSAPEQILVTGCSAGSLGSILWSADVMQHYPDTQVIQLGDSDAGVITEEFYREDFPRWNAEPAYPTFIPALAEPSGALRIEDFYVAIGAQYPTNFVSQFNSAFDSTQPIFYAVMGGDAQAWSTEMRASLDAIAAATDNFAAFVPAGTLHCVLPRDELYTITADGRPFLDWFDELITTGSVESARCTTDCEVAAP